MNSGKERQNSMTIEQLQYFMAIVKYKNFSTAAEECYISQSSLSKQIKALEQELGGIELFKRNTKRLEITEAGSEFLISAGKILMEHQKMINKMKQYTKNNTTVLTVGTIPVLDHYGLTDVLFRFQDYYPNIRLNVIEANSVPLAEHFSKGKIDIGFFRDSYLPKGNFETFPLLNDHIVLVVSTSHPLAKYDDIDLLEAENENFLLSGGISDICRNACVEAGFIPKTQILEVRNRTIKKLVANNQGVSLMMCESIKFMNDPAIKFIHLKTPVIVKLVLVVRKEAMTDAVSTLIEYIRDSFGKL